MPNETESSARIHHAELPVVFNVPAGGGVAGLKVTGGPGALIGGGERSNRFTVRCLGIARHHAVGRSESKGSLKSRSESNDIRRRSLCQGRIECPDRGYSYNDRKSA